MSFLHSCACGAKIKLPEERSGKMFRCPRCKVEFVPTPDAKVLVSTAAVEADGGGLCPICQSSIAREEIVLTCPDCDQTHHRECWQEVGGCSTYGCKQAPAATKEATTAPPTAWGDTKSCPACGETIKSIALRCRYCSTNFKTVDPLSAADLVSEVHQKKNRLNAQNTTIVLFVLSLSGFLAPLALILSPFLIIRQRQALAKAGMFYLVLGYSTIGLSLVYSLMIVIFLIFSDR